MTRPYALRRLLDLGPLTLAELIDITRWPYRASCREDRKTHLKVVT